MENECPVCSTKLSKAKGNSRHASDEIVQYFSAQNCVIHIGDLICQKCYMKYYKEMQKKKDTGSTEKSASSVVPEKRPISPDLSSQKPKRQRSVKTVN